MEDQANKRKLASIRTIDNIEPIENADAIEVVVVGGWRVISRKGIHQIGDPVVYIEIDSFLPDGVVAWQDLVDKSSRIFEGQKGHKLRSMKMRGVVSQGFVLPIMAVPQVVNELGLKEKWTQETDSQPAEQSQDLATEIKKVLLKAIKNNIDQAKSVDLAPCLNIKKWEAELPSCLQGQAAGLFPSFLRKSDQERAANIKNEIFGYEDTKVELDVKPDQLDPGALASGRVVVEDGKVFSIHKAKASPNDQYELTLKLDGSSFTGFVIGEQRVLGDDELAVPTWVPRIGVASRNLELKINDENKDNSFVRAMFDTNLNVALEKFYTETGRSIGIQGELCGPGIQGNREDFKVPHLFVFDIFDIDKQQFVGPAERQQIYNKLTEIAVTLHHVPVINPCTTLGALGLNNIDDLIAYADGPSLNHPIREGVVFKRLDGQFSFKQISNKFLLKEKD